MQTITPTLAIYDENKMFRQLLHNQMERQGFPVSFSCNQKSLLYEYLSEAKGLPSLVLIGVAEDWKKTLKVFKQIKFLCGQVEAIIYICKESPSIAAEFIKAGARKVIVSCSVEKLVSSLDSVFSKPVSDKAKPGILSGIEIVRKNEKYVLILKGLSRSESVEEISDNTGLTVDTVKTYKKRIMKELDCRKASEAVAKAKDAKIL